MMTSNACAMIANGGSKGMLKLKRNDRAQCPSPDDGVLEVMVNSVAAIYDEGARTVRPSEVAAAG
jgi:hypothetical protein